MKPIQFKKEYTLTTKRTDLLGDALTSFFGKPLYWVKNKYNRARVERAFHIAQKEGDKDFTHFMQNIMKG